MNRTDAAAILNLDPSASPEEARRAYQELFTEHQVRLTNAPTPALRSLYQARLLELEEAKDAILAPSLSDAMSDLPTDQPSIPSPSTYPPRQAPPPPRRDAPPPPKATQPPAQVQAQKKEPSPPAGASRKWSGKKKFFVIFIFVGAVYGLVRLLSPAESDGSASPSVPGGGAESSADSIPALRENITVARVEFGRGDYDAANTALTEADRHYSALGSAAKSDTAVTRLKDQLDQLHTKVSRACDALKKVAERHPGEPTCKTI
jgi:hypothetical protein